METISKTIFRTLTEDINNEMDSSGLFLPKIQREFVWDEARIYKLFDSIMRQYPISTLLIWKTQSEVQHRKFMTNFQQNLDYTELNIEWKKKQFRSYVLDGQQRLQSLYLGVCGRYEGKYLYFKLSEEEEDPDDEYLYDFKFMTRHHAKWPWVKFRDILETQGYGTSAIVYLQQKELIPQDISAQEKDVAAGMVGLAKQTFCGDLSIVYQLVDGAILKKEEDDILNIFSRANSGGVVLDKTELLFSVIKSFWSEADEELQSLINTLNADGFNFDKDFILRSCLVILNRGAQYKVDKFRDQELKKQLQDHWSDIAKVIKEVKDFVRDKTYIKSAKALATDTPLIPLIYFRYHYPDQWQVSQQICRDFIIRALISGAFAGITDKIIDEIVKTIMQNGRFDVEAIDYVCEKNGRGLSVTRERILSEGYGSKSIHLVFNLLYGSINYRPAFEGNNPQIDHIFPKSKLSKITEGFIDSETGKNRRRVKYPPYIRNQIANCMLLTMDENVAGPSGKGTMMPEDWFVDKGEEYLDLHLIPRDKELWKLDNFEQFIEARKNLLIEKLGQFLKIESGE
jgi:hypothetical protein